MKRCGCVEKVGGAALQRFYVRIILLFSWATGCVADAFARFPRQRLQEAGIAAGRLDYAYSAMSLSGQEPAVVSEESLPHAPT